jgi:hypothetical protein
MFNKLQISEVLAPRLAILLSALQFFPWSMDCSWFGLAVVMYECGVLRRSWVRNTLHADTRMQIGGCDDLPIKWSSTMPSNLLDFHWIATFYFQQVSILKKKWAMFVPLFFSFTAYWMWILGESSNYIQFMARISLSLSVYGFRCEKSRIFFIFMSNVSELIHDH